MLDRSESSAIEDHEAVPLSDVESLESLLAATARGDRPAFARLYEATSARLFAVTLRLLGRRDVAEDVLQEAYIAIWRKAGLYQPRKGAPLAWMMTIARYRAIDRLRRDGGGGRELKDWDDVADGPANLLAANAGLPDAIAATIRKCVEGLQVNQKKAILLAYYYGMTHEELAKHLGSPLGTIKSRVRRGLVRLQECYDR